MVFSGRPSTACQDCRAKRRKCDRALPGCSQCSRQNIPCQGYRDVSALRLRDETAITAWKVQNARYKRNPTNPAPCKPPSPYPAPLSGRREHLDPFEWQDELEEIPLVPLSLDVLAQPVETTATVYFMTSFIISSPFEGYLPSLHKSDPLAQDAVSTAIRAASLATFAMRLGDTRYLKTARTHYSLALAQTNASLACPKEALLDRTLAAVLLLGLFEAVIFQGRQSPESWTAHTLGALELLRLRGAHQFQSELAQHLFVQTITNIRTSCIQRLVPVPPECLALHAQAMPFLDPKDPSLRLGPVIDRAASLRARAKVAKCPQLIYEARDIDDEAVALIDSLEGEQRYSLRSKQDTPFWAYLGIAYHYPNHRVAKYWNAIRMLRMFLNELIWRLISLGFDDPHFQQLTDTGPCDPLCKCIYLEALKQKAAENMRAIATDVLASVPDFLDPNKDRGRFYPFARTLTWPLSILLTSPVYTLPMKKHAVVLLHELGRDLNLSQAVDAANMLDDPEISEDWLHLSHLT